MTAFSNHSEFEVWATDWCNACVKDDGETLFCPILDAVFCDNVVPPEWSDGTNDLSDRYRCESFEQR